MLVVNYYGIFPENLLLLIRLQLCLTFFIDSLKTASVFILETLKETSDIVHRDW